MKLSQLFEAVESKTGEELWDTVSGDASTYTPSTVYQVKPSESKRGEFDVYTDKDNKRTLYATMSTDDLRDSLEKIRPSDKPDGEGYTMYRSRETLEAAQYRGDPVTVSDVANAQLKKGDYLVRSTSGSEFVYSVEPESFFNDKYTKV